MGDWEAKTGYDELAKHVQEHRKAIRRGSIQLPDGTYNEPIKLPLIKEDDPILSVGEYRRRYFGEFHDDPTEIQFHQECQHEPIDVGFRFSKWVCKKCNKDLPNEPR